MCASCDLPGLGGREPDCMVFVGPAQGIRGGWARAREVPVSRPGPTLVLPRGDRLGAGLAEAGERFSGPAMERATGAPRTDGNALRLQFEGSITFDAWIEAILAAERHVHFENYILRDDRIGRTFRDVLIEKARQGIEVRVLYDWVGCWATPARFWRPFRDAGVEVRAFNRPNLRDPFGILQRDHRKLVVVDGVVAFVGGFCVGVEWAGDVGAGVAPWRDTGVEVRGPAAAAAAQTFQRIWGEIGPAVREAARSDPGAVPATGSTPVWVIEGEPWRSRVYRATQLAATSARERLWITDPYFVAPRPVSEALAAAARDGVDVRILVPGHNNWPVVGSLSRGGYRFLLEAGVRIFEWQGPMIHSKSAVADGIWSRVGSSNLNAASLLGNWEIDVAVLDAELAAQLEGLFFADLTSSVEIVLPGRIPSGIARRGGDGGERYADLPPPPRSPLEPEGTLQQRIGRWTAPGGSTGWRIADLVRAGSTLGDALAGHRTLAREGRMVLLTGSIGLLLAGALTLVFPQVVAWSIAFVLGWLGIVGVVRALAASRARNREGEKQERGWEKR
ncbi:MAG: cardiolipin synthase B [Gemmatimonadetes bacterium]|nr:cardiolipin synthase B [Gemmatimonadota bacterium]